MNIKSLFILILLFLPTVASAKLDSATRNRMMQDASHAFLAGKYDVARKIYYDIYVEDGDTDSKELLNKCQQCRTLLADASSAERNGDYQVAIEKYLEVLNLNPSDNKIPALISQCKKRLYAPILQLAKQNYREGKYVEARDNLSEYTYLSGAADPDILTAITEGITWSNEAKIAFENKDYKKASEYYNRLLQLNPTDVTSARALATINKLSQPTKVVYVEKTKPKMKLIPDKNCFNFRALSGFDKPTVFGAYIGYNFKLFQIGVDFAIGNHCDIDDENISNDDITKLKNKAVLIHENKQYSGSPFPSNDNVYYGVEYNFFSPKFQFAISPGLNFKYFTVECGLGAMIGSDYAIHFIDAFQMDNGDKQYLRESLYLNDKKSVSHFLIRPTVTGFIPVTKKHKGFSISFGYNIVSGMSSLNGIIFGVGFFL